MLQGVVDPNQSSLKVWRPIYILCQGKPGHALDMQSVYMESFVPYAAIWKVGSGRHVACER